MAEPKLCSIPDCGKTRKAHGLCAAHYYRLRKHGDPLGGGETPGKALRFINDVVICHQGGECITWPYSDNGKGYGVINLNGKMQTVSRYVCELVNGPPPTPDHEAAHSCGKGREGCVSPHHLSWKTVKDNHADKLVHGTHQRGSKCPTSKLKDADVLEIRRLKGELSQSAIASLFGISFQQVSLIHRRLRWAWLE